MKTRTKGFIVSFILVFAMLIGLFTIMPMTSSAASDTITVTGLTAPQAGQSVMEWAEDNYPVFSPAYDLDFGAFVEGEYVNWEEAGEALDNVGPFEGTFEDGKKYTLVAIVVPDDGETPAAATVVASGTSNTAYEKLEERVAALLLTYTVGGGASGPTLTVDGIPIPDDGQTVEQWRTSGEMTITGANIQPINFFVLEGSYTNTTEAIAYFSGGGSPMTDADTFEAGKQYTLYFGVVPTDETPLPASATVTAAGTNSATYELWTDPEGGDPIGIIFLTYTAGAEPITITGLPVPQVGQSAEQSYGSITTPPTISPALEWGPICYVEAKISTYEELITFFEGGGEEYPYTAPFTNKQYTFILTANANAEVALPRYGAVSAAGTSSTGYDYIEDPEGDYAFIFLTYTLGESSAATSALAGLPVPLAGMSVEAYTKTTRPFITRNIGVPVDGAIFELPNTETPFTGTFVAGKQYEICLRMQFSLGAPATLTLTADGADSVRYERIDEGYGIVFVTFTAKEFSGTVIESLDITMPEVGTQLGFGYPVKVDSDKVNATLVALDASDESMNGLLNPTIKNNNFYYCFLIVTAKDGAVFDDYTDMPALTIGGKTFAINEEYSYAAGNMLYVEFEYTLGDPPEVRVDGVGLADGNYLANGSSTPTKEKPASGYAYYMDGVLTLHDFVLETNAAREYLIANLLNGTTLRIVLEGNNVINAPKCDYLIHNYGTVEIGGTGSLTLTANEYAIRSYDLAITGGTITVNAEYDCIMADQLAISGGMITLNSESEAIYAHEGIEMTGGTMTVNAGSNSWNAIRVPGSVYGLEITNATLNINMAGDYPVIRSTFITVGAGGTLNVDAPNNSHLCSECETLTVNGGTLSFTSTGACIYVRGNINFNGTVQITTNTSYAIRSESGTVHITGGTVEVKNSGGKAFFAAPTISGGLYAQAATTVGGTMSTYNAADNGFYKHVMITDEAPAPTYSATLGDIDFGSITEGDTVPKVKPIVMTNTGTGVINQPRVEIISGGEYFTLKTFSVPVQLGAGTVNDSAYGIQPKADLAPGTYTATIRLTGTELSAPVTATVTITVNPVATYTITVVGGTANPSSAKAGVQITLTADPAPAGKQFDKWVITSGQGFIGVPTNPTTTFVMSAENLTIKATYKDAPVYSATIDDLDFGELREGYSSVAGYPVITNTGNQILQFGSAYLKAEMSGNDAFTYGWNSYAGAVSVGNTMSNNLWVRLRSGLAQGTYTATLSLYCDRDGNGTAYDWELLDTCTITATIIEKASVSHIELTYDPSAIKLNTAYTEGEAQRAIRSNIGVASPGISINQSNSWLAFIDGSSTRGIGSGTNMVSADKSYVLEFGLNIAGGYQWCESLRNGSLEGVTILINGVDMTDELYKVELGSNILAVYLLIGAPDTTTIVTDVEIVDNELSIKKGDAHTFTAIVSGNVADKSVIWTIEGAQSAATVIDADGKLTVGADETAETLTVKATAAADASFSATVTVTVLAEDPYIESVTISPETAEMTVSTSKTFTVTVLGTQADKRVTWSVEGAQSVSTTIDENGRLTVGADETAETLTVKATANMDGTKIATATVTVKQKEKITGVTLTYDKDAISLNNSTTEGAAQSAIRENIAVSTTGVSIDKSNSWLAIRRADNGNIIGIGDGTAMVDLNKIYVVEYCLSVGAAYDWPATLKNKSLEGFTVTVNGVDVTDQVLRVDYNTTYNDVYITIKLEKAVCTAHVPADDDGDCTTAINCTLCGVETTPAKTSHTGGTATCNAKAICEECGKEYGEFADHTFVDGKCEFGEEDPNYVPPHEHNFVEGKCECGETDPNYTPGTDTPGTDVPGTDKPGNDDPQTPDNPQTPDDNDGLGTGAIVGIVVGSVAVLGGGGFALFWFVIEKKTWAELLAIFKKTWAEFLAIFKKG